MPKWVGFTNSQQYVHITRRKLSKAHASNKDRSKQTSELFWFVYNTIVIQQYTPFKNYHTTKTNLSHAVFFEGLCTCSCWDILHESIAKRDAPVTESSQRLPVTRTHKCHERNKQKNSEEHNSLTCKLCLILAYESQRQNHLNIHSPH